jgi:DNA-directed RNA polymerase specialized sigma24 family protein
VLGDREAAAEVAQEVAIVALRQYASLRDPRALDGWLYRTAVRASLPPSCSAGSLRVSARR